jgi:pyruvate formate lyase activating enzyme
MVNVKSCARCGKCFAPCAHEECAPFGRCLRICPNGLVAVSGERYSADALAARLRKNADIFAQSGGVTFSGGEPLLQADFVIETAKRLAGVHAALETSGYAETDAFLGVLARMDYILFDLKIADAGAHEKYTGRSNEKILENLNRLRRSGKPYTIRVPLVPGVTDTAENLAGIRRLAAGAPIEYLPYNALAAAKYPMVARKFAL